VEERFLDYTPDIKLERYPVRIQGEDVLVELP